MKVGDLVKYKEEYLLGNTSSGEGYWEDVGIITRIKDKMPSLSCMVLWSKNPEHQEFEWVDELEILNESR